MYFTRVLSYTIVTYRQLIKPYLTSRDINFDMELNILVLRTLIQFRKKRYQERLAILEKQVLS